MSMEPSLAGPVRVAAPPDDLCLRFANTRYWRGSPAPTEELHATADLLAWAAKECGQPAGVLRHCAAEWHDGAGAAALEEALRLREAIFTLFAGLAAGGDAPPAALDVLNAALADAPPRLRLALSAQQHGWEVDGPPSLLLLLAPVLWSAGDLALGPRAGRVRQCANPACQWLFLDDSKSGNRRWCSMRACGNRAKAHRHYLRQKAGRDAA